MRETGKRYFMEYNHSLLAGVRANLMQSQKAVGLWQARTNLMQNQGTSSMETRVDKPGVKSGNCRRLKLRDELNLLVHIG